VAATFLRNTLRRLSKHKLEKLRQEFGAGALGSMDPSDPNSEDMSALECYKGFPYAFWAYSKHPLSQSLTKMTEPEEEQVAIQIFALILTYAGLVSNSKFIKMMGE